MAKTKKIDFRVTDAKFTAVNAKIAAHNANKKTLDPLNLSEVMNQLIDKWLADEIEL
jgi:hypothetical protein